MPAPSPDLFTNAHKGIRRALFAACNALGRAGSDPERLAAAKATLREALRFVEHHGGNEDRLLVPRLETRAPEVSARMTAAHQALEPELRALVAGLGAAEATALYGDACSFTALYLQHLDEEERQLEPLIRAAMSAAELAAFARRAVEQTAADDKAMMLRWMLPAMPEADARGFLAQLPQEIAAPLLPLLRAG